MNLEYYITRKIIKDKNKSNFSKNAIGIAVLSVALGLSVMIISVAIVTGFQKEITDKVIGFGAHIQITKFDNNASLEPKPIKKSKVPYKKLYENKEIIHVQSFCVKPSIVKYGENTHGIVVKGIASDFSWHFFEERIVEGQKMSFSDSVISDKVIVSKKLAKLLNLKIDDNIQLWFVQEPFRVRKLTICGIYETGLEEFDNMFVFADLRYIQDINGWDSDQISGIEIFIKDIDKLNDVNDYVNEVTSYSLYDEEFDYQNLDTEDYLYSKTIKEIYPGIFDWLGLLDMNAIVILIIMLFIASVNMITTLLIIILERTRMIGILKAIGAKSVSITKIFIYYALFILVKGLLWGNLISIVLCLIQIYFGVVSLPAESYFVSKVSVNLNVFHILVLNAGTIVCCLLILILPAFIVTRFSTVSALKYD